MWSSLPQPLGYLQSTLPFTPGPGCREPPSQASSSWKTCANSSSQRGQNQDGPPRGCGGQGAARLGSPQGLQRGQDGAESGAELLLRLTAGGPWAVGLLLHSHLAQRGKHTGPICKPRRAPQWGRRCGVACLEGQDRRGGLTTAQRPDAPRSCLRFTGTAQKGTISSGGGGGAGRQGRGPICRQPRLTVCGQQPREEDRRATLLSPLFPPELAIWL